MTHRISYLTATAVALCLFAYAVPAQAQIERATDIADPSRIDEQLRSQPFDPSAGPKIEVKEILPQNAPEGPKILLLF